MILATNMASTPFIQRFTGQFAIVTGAARGIGFAIASRLAKEGAAVALLDVDEDAATQAVAKLQNPLCTSVAVDVRNKNSVATAFQTITEKFSTIHVLVNAAGITGCTNIRTAEVDPEDWEKVYAVNVRGLFLTCRLALPIMERQKYGRILNIASISGKEGNAGMAAYSSSKAAVIGLTKVIGKEYATTGITCNAIAPAVVQTEMVAALPKQQVYL